MFLQSLTACPIQSVDSSSFTSDFVARMSKEEVAELAQAIHSHADALYESWTKGPDVMRRMEDTLELLADPGLTPKLEHLVSNFVRRDKAKRQQFRQQQSPPKTVDSADTLNSNARDQPLNGSSPPGLAVNKKPLPKSILAVVQRFEPSPERTNKERAASPANDLVKVALPGIGLVNKNVLWAESSSRHQVSEKNLGRQTSPVPNKTFVGAHQNYNSNNSVVATNGGTRVVRERHIPIERCDRDESPSPGNVPSSENNSHAPAVRSNRLQSQNQNQGDQGKAQLQQVDFIGGADIHELEREEEKLFRALRTGQVVPPGQTSDPNSLDLLREKATSPSNSRVAFAKERIRQSQEHPLTQQRLELQKRLPSPSGSLAAAIAMQQGKTKFQPNHHSNGTHSLNGSPVDDEVGANKENSGGSPNNTTNGIGGGNAGRQGWVTTVLRFGPGSSVADRVQLFEKYPAHIVNSTANSSYVPVVVSVPNSTTSPSPPKEANSHWSRKHTTHSPTSNSTNNTNTYNAGNVSAPWRIPVPTETQHQTDIVLGPTAKQFKGAPKVSPPVHRNSVEIPRFFWPEGALPATPSFQQNITKAEDYIAKCSGSVSFSQFGQMLVAIGVPFYWKKPFWKVFGLKPNDTLSAKSFIPFYKSLLKDCPDDAARFIRILSTAGKFSDDSIANITNNNRHSSAYENHGKLPWDLRTAEASMSDFTSMIQDIIDTHPGLGFLRDAPEFHSRYITTVISRIFYKINRSWTGRMTLSELRRSNLLKVIKRLEEETDVNNIKEYFSYEHFYVIYCKFWELDTDHDLLIDKSDLAAHSDRSLSSRIIDRIFSGTVLRGWEASSPVKCGPGKMTYSDFVWFLLSEEDKKTPTAIEYWFRCLDMDGDGILSPYELEYFYSEQANRIEALNIEPLDFKNIYCQIADMLHCSTTVIRLRDLKKNPSLAATVFNTLFNLEKYLDHEQRDPFATATSASGSHDSIEGDTDWDKYAAAEYEFLIAEENPNDAYHGSDFEDNSGLLSP